MTSTASLAPATRRSVVRPRTAGADGGAVTPAALAAQAMDLVGSDPAQAVLVAERALAAARSRPDAAARTLAWRVTGLVARTRGDLVAAREALDRAVRSASQAGDRASAAEARMTLSFVLLDLGLTSRALRQSARAAGDLEGLAAGRLQVQRALILQRCGRLNDALVMYAAAMPVLRAADDEVWESRACSNLGVLHAYRGDLACAQEYLVRAHLLERRSGREMDAAMSLWNLGCLARERGDVVQALERFDEAEPVLMAHGPLPGQCSLDRASLLLSVGVVAEARVLAERARDAFAAASQATDLMECQALLARIALLEQDPEAAVELARTARRVAARQDRPGWVLWARLIEVLAQEALASDDKGLVKRAVALAAGLSEAHWSDAAHDATLVAVRIAASQGHLSLARTLLDQADAMRPTVSAALQVRRWHTVAVVREQSGDARGAATAVRAGITVLARHRASLGASDLQAYAAASGEQLARVGLRLAVRSGSAARVLREVERWRGQDLNARPVRPPQDPELSLAVERLRRASAELRDAALSSGPTAGIIATVAARERDVVRLSRRTRAGSWRPAPPPAGTAELREGLGSRVMVEYLAVDGQLLAVTVLGAGLGRSGRPVVRLHPLGPLQAVQDLLVHLQFALSRLATGRGSARSLAGALASAHEVAGALDAMILRPLQPGLDGDGLVIAPTEALHAIPWSLLVTAARGPVHLVRSGTAWLAAHRRGTQPDAVRRPRREVFVTGPGVTLAPPSTTPMSQVSSADDVLLRLDGDRARVAPTLAALDGATMAHIAAHGSFRSDNPLLSCLSLADGPLTVYDLEELARPPDLVVLASCHSAAAQVLPGDQMLGVAHALLTLGAGGVVATTLPAPDAESAVLMRELHDLLGAGMATGTALHQARQVLDLGAPTGLATSAGFDLYGC